MKPKKKRFLELISGIDINNPVMDFDRYGNKLFWFDDQMNLMILYDVNANRVWVNNNRIGSVIRREYGVGADDIYGFLNNMLIKYFKINAYVSGYLTNLDGFVFHW